MGWNERRLREGIRRVAITLALLGIIAGIVAACGTADSRPGAQENEARIAQSVAATVDAQLQIEQAVAATVAAQQPGAAANDTGTDAPMPARVAAGATATATPRLSVATPAPTDAATPTRQPTPTATRRPTATPAPTATRRPTATPTRRPTPTPEWRPPTSSELGELKQFMLELTNAERAKYDAPALRLGDNASPQIHAERGLENCYSSHWDLWGFKPLYRYALAGGDQYADENGSGIDYCPKAGDNYRVNYPRYWRDEVRDAVDGWINSPGHHRNLIDPAHTVMHAGIAIGKYGNSNIVQVFSGDYLIWGNRPAISSATLTASGQMHGAFYDEDDNYVLATIEYHPPTHRLTAGQLVGTYCLEVDIRVGKLFEPLDEGWYYTDPDTGREYTDYTSYTSENSQCVNPYELPADRPTPTSWKEASAQHAAAIELAGAMPDEESVAYAIVSEMLDVSSDGRAFNIRADLSPILSHYGPGIYTLTIWATTPDTYISKYPIWWHIDPTSGHPY